MIESYPTASAEFKLSITRAMADQLAESLRRLRPEHLTKSALANLQSRPGVYELFVNGERVYVGKASKSLPDRLGDHLRKLSGRRNISLADVSFQCLYVDEDLEAAAPERMLIKKYKAVGGTPWNTNGFGNNDPGRNRDRSLVKQNHFDARYPINLEFPFCLPSREFPVSEFLLKVKSVLPFNLRYEKGIAQKVAGDSIVHLPPGVLPASELIGKAIEALPDGWQATALPGYVILYHENAVYKSALTVWRRQNGTVVESAGEHLLADPGKIEEDQIES